MRTALHVELRSLQKHKNEVWAQPKSHFYTFARAGYVTTLAEDEG